MPCHSLFLPQVSEWDSDLEDMVNPVTPAVAATPTPPPPNATITKEVWSAVYHYCIFIIVFCVLERKSFNTDSVYLFLFACALVLFGPHSMLYCKILFNSIFSSCPRFNVGIFCYLTKWVLDCLY